MRCAAPALLALAAALASCGGGDAAEGGEQSRLLVSAAASMSEALRECSPAFEGADVRLSLAGSDELAAQIRQGVKPDVYAAANAKLPEALSEEGRLSEPVTFAGNTLVLAVPSDSKIGSLADAAQPGTKLAIGSASVPVGSYTREVLAMLSVGQRRALLANVRSKEPDVKGVVGKLAQGAGCNGRQGTD